MSDPLQRARWSLEGLSVGDGFGDTCFARSGDVQTRLAKRQLAPPPWHWSDDTLMALSIYSALRKFGPDGIDQNGLARSFATRFDRSRGYGSGMLSLLVKLRAGEPWQEAALRLFSGQGSFGNGGAMRIAPLGAYYADNLDQVVDQARKATEVTHAHAEGIAGGIAIAVAAALAYRAREATQVPTRIEFIDSLLPYIPESFVREKVRHARNLTEGSSLELAVAALGNGSQITAQDSVAFCVWCAGEHLTNYEEAIWLTAAGGGDVDTTCAIVGGIVASYTGSSAIRGEWIAHREPLPAWPFNE